MFSYLFHFSLLYLSNFQVPRARQKHTFWRGVLARAVPQPTTTTTTTKNQQPQQQQQPPQQQPIWLKLPSRLKILVKNSTSVLSIHLDQVPARSVGWPLVYFFLLTCPLTWLILNDLGFGPPFCWSGTAAACWAARLVQYCSQERPCWVRSRLCSVRLRSIPLTEFGREAVLRLRTANGYTLRSLVRFKSCFFSQTSFVASKYVDYLKSWFPSTNSKKKKERSTLVDAPWLLRCGCFFLSVSLVPVLVVVPLVLPMSSCVLCPCLAFVPFCLWSCCRVRLLLLALSRAAVFAFLFFSFCLVGARVGRCSVRLAAVVLCFVSLSRLCPFLFVVLLSCSSFALGVVSCCCFRLFVLFFLSRWCPCWSVFRSSRRCRPVFCVLVSPLSLFVCGLVVVFVFCSWRCLVLLFSPFCSFLSVSLVPVLVGVPFVSPLSSCVLCPCLAFVPFCLWSCCRVRFLV